MGRLDNLTENEIKELDKEIIRDTISVLQDYIMLSSGPDPYEVAELYELKIAEKYLRSPFFEKRVRGINDLKEIFYKVKNSQQVSKAQLEA
mmetsp:Transcript_29753/g.22069  ORF Transcript_29753/g.22069 Transcript_29753/m.22069 type:complete len:91 (-) Transcript_29753:91-363(-)|eukprot:CAMPEP_0202974866 /NCGR_PEP_ID=MMETSP1396-20130829/64661_1 /ASSEMBLY_ACC=CAM_ASM_000872 /TAXON_ID= /ORGANISM="Pseudokeronopsis sp., Strain Brazil" /LENGTH=90 /DNA_ID=CAMNT_0049709523 /DNA_START=143 /DNA_END=415 /DNA_ORIENTATION=+